jgi:hypothetical protein
MTTLTPEEFKKKYGYDAIARFEEIKQTQNDSTVSSRVGSSLKESGQQALEQITGTGASSGTSAPTRGFQLASTVTGAPVRAAMSALPESVQTGIGKVGKVIATPINWLGDKIGNIQGLQEYLRKNPQADKVVTELAQIAQSTSETAGNVVAIQGGIATGKNIVGGAKQGVDTTVKLAQKGTELAKTGFDATKGFVAGARDVIKPIIQEAKTLPGKAKANIAQTRATEATIKSLKPAGQTAVRSGVELADVKSLYSFPKSLATKLKGLAESVKKFASGKSNVDPSEIVGKPIMQGFNKAQSKANTIGSKIGKVADTLPKVTTAQVAPKVISSLKKVRGLEGLKVSSKGVLDFKNTTLATAGTRADRITIQKIFNDAIKAGSGKSKHLLRQELFEILGGKKKSGLALTGTQEKAFEAVRKGLADTLDEFNTTYKALSMEYAKALSPINSLKKILKASGLDDDLANMKAGTLARRLTSNSLSKADVKQILRDLDKVIGTASKTGLSAEKLQDFYNILDKYYDISGRTGFQGQVTAGVSKALEKGGLSKAVDIVEGQVARVFGETDIVKQKALEEILKDILK